MRHPHDRIYSSKLRNVTKIKPIYNLKVDKRRGTVEHDSVKTGVPNDYHILEHKHRHGS